MIDEGKVKAGKGNTELAACRQLMGLAREVPSNELIVELGAYKGRTTAWLALGAERGNGVPVLAVDPWDLRAPGDWPGDYADHLAFDTYGRSETREAFEAHMKECGVTRFAQVRSFAADCAATHSSPQVGLLYHDAEHTAEAVETDLRAWLPHLADRCVVALHDVGNPRFGVLEGAERVLVEAGFSWPPSVQLWRKHPDRRGLAVVRRG